jgi:hypothetical protein
MVKHFLLPLMKRKNNSKLNEGVQIPYRLQDFKEGDRVHVIGVFDDINFDDLGTIVTTSREIENPWSREDSILIKFDEPKESEYGLHDGETGNKEIADKCDYRCWWIWMASFIPHYEGSNPDDYYYKKNNRIIKLDDNLPSAYDVISSLYESTDLIKENVIYPGIKVGDEVIVSIGDESTYGPIIDKFATVVSVTEGGTLLVKLKNFNQGHDGNNNIHCGERDCLFLNGSWYEKLIIRPVESLDMPDAYDVISSLYESKEDDLDWAMDMVNDIANKSIKLSLIPKNKDKNFYLIYFDKPGITYETIQNILTYVKESTIWGNTLTRRDVEALVPYLYDNYLEKGFVYFSLKPNGQSGYGNTENAFSRVNNIKITAPNVKIIRPYPYGENINESDDLDWASDMVNDVDLNSVTMSVITQIPTTVDPVRFHYIGFKGPGITEKNIADVVWFTEKNTNYKPFVDAANTIDNIYNLYLKNGVAYIVLKPSNQKAVGSSPNAFEIINKVKMNNPKEVNVIKFIADKKINESDDLDWAMDMVNDVNLAITSIPTEDNGKKYVILFDKPGITYETIETIVNYIEKKTVWYFTDVDSVTSSIYGDIKRGWSPYIRLFPGPELSFGDDESTFNNSTGLYFNSPQVNIIRPY